MELNTTEGDLSQIQDPRILATSFMMFKISKFCFVAVDIIVFLICCLIGELVESN